MVTMQPSRRFSPKLKQVLKLFAGCAAVIAAATTCYPVSLPDTPQLHVEPPQPANRSASEAKRHAPAIDHIVVVTIDGVRWQEVFGGVDSTLTNPMKLRRDQALSPAALLPNIHRIAATHGVLLGKDDSQVRVSSPSTVSLPGYTELFSGRTPHCGNNDCPQTAESTLLDDWHRASKEATMMVFSSWERIPRAVARDPSHLILSAGRSHVQGLAGLASDAAFQQVLTKGAASNPAPGVDDYRPDGYTAELGLLALEALKPSFLFLSLGDTDEHAHHGDYEAYLSALQQADRVVGRLDAWLQTQQQIGKRTLLVVTTDHGRASSFQHHGSRPEAARIWTLWSGDDVKLRGYPAAGPSRLADIASTLRRVVDLPPDPHVEAGHHMAALFEQPARPIEQRGDWRLVANRSSYAPDVWPVAL